MNPIHLITKYYTLSFVTATCPGIELYGASRPLNCNPALVYPQSLSLNIHGVQNKYLAMAEAGGADQLANLHLDDVTGEKVRFVRLRINHRTSALNDHAAKVSLRNARNSDCRKKRSGKRLPPLHPNPRRRRRREQKKNEKVNSRPTYVQWTTVGKN